MTEHDLSTLVRDHVSSDEPPFALTPNDSIRRGRRTVRARRLVAGGAALAVLAVGGAAATQLTKGDRPTEPASAVDSATQAFLDSYDAAQMPRILEEESRSVFGRSVPDLGRATFEATDNGGAELPAKWWDRASGMSVSYGGDSEHRLSVDLAHSRSEAEGDAQKYCKNGLDDGSYLDCTAEARDDGSVVITNLWALRPFKSGGFMVVTRDQLATFDSDRLWFERRVKVVKSETFVTYVSETVRAPSVEAARDTFRVPVEDLVEVATDPQVVMPAPEPDPVSGCPGFVIPGTATCGTFEEPEPDEG